VDVDGLVTTSVGLVPDIGEELSLGHDPPEVGCQVVQQVELLAAQKQVSISERGLTSGRVDPKGPDRDRQRFGVLPRSPQDRPETRLELPGGEGLDDVVVGSRVEGLNDPAFVISGSDDDNGDRAHGPEHAEQVDAVDVRQAEVQQDDVRLLSDDGRQPPKARRGSPHVVSHLDEGPFEPGSDARIVLDYQDRYHTRHSIRPLTRPMAGSRPVGTRPIGNKPVSVSSPVQSGRHCR